MSMYRERLYHFKTQRKLWNYFAKNAGYHEGMQIYSFAGICAVDTRELWLMTIEEWKKDIADQAKRFLTG